MSASPEKKAQTRAQRDEQRRKEEQKDRRAMALYTVIGVVVLVSAIALMFWRSGILQRSLTALNVNGTKYTAVELQYYYNTLYSSHASSYDFLPGASVKEQVYDQETGQSWYDHLLEEAVEELTADTALAAQAKNEGYTLSDEAQQSLDATVAQLDTIWISYSASSRDAFIRASFGPYMTYDKLVSLIELDYLSSDYASARLDAIEHPDSDYESYYRENTDTLDTLIYTRFTFQAALPTTDAEGNPIEWTDEEKAEQLETLKAEQKALAEEVLDKLEDGEDPADLAEEYAGELYSSSVSLRTTTANASYSTDADWLLDSARRTGDVTLTERDIGDTFYYYVVQFEDRFRDNEDTHSVRHILIRAGDGTADPTQEEYDAAETEAQTLLDEWKAGEATEESFALLAAANSADSSSAVNGGLISGITSSSSYVESFLNWSIASTRRDGDTALVKSEYGWHIMYYSSTDLPIWKQTARSALQAQDYEDLTAEITQGWNVTQGTGMRFITA